MPAFDYDEMTRNSYIARRFRQALRDSGWDAGTIAWRAKVTRGEMARVLRGDETVQFGHLVDVAFHIGLKVEVLPAPKIERVAGPIPTVLDQALQRLSRQSRG